MMENTDANILTEVLVGLSKGQKSIPPKYLYDKRGTEIYGRICELEEYYLTRVENLIMRTYGREMARFIGSNALIIEPGSGNGEKIRHLLSRLSRAKGYVPIEISPGALEKTVSELQRFYPKLPVVPVSADFTQDFELPDIVSGHTGKKVIFFPGSTIGNFHPDEALEFLRRFSKIAGEGGGILIGVDMKKDRTELEHAYDDSKGVTREFNLNLLERLNREANASFELQNFDHTAFYNQDLGRVEMHLVSKVSQQVRVNQTIFRFNAGETIHTESSYKYSVEEFCELAAKARLKLRKFWQDPSKMFCTYYFERE